MKTLVTYACSEYNERVEFFIKHGIFKSENVDFLFVINNETLKFDVPDFVTVINRENTGYDFGGWSYGTLEGDRYKKYDYFIFVNQSVVGPYFSDKTKQWTDIFISKLSDDVKLVGSTINAMVNSTKFQVKDYAHVQSFAFCVDKETFKFLIDCGIFSNIYLENKDRVIWEREVKMSRLILNNGWNIASLSKIYDGVDFRFKNKNPEDYADVIWLGDLLYPHYESIVYTREEVLFVKGNRDMLF